jgi:GTP-binding protein
MARLPVVAIIGRPNTGKSTIFNRLVRKRMAIESDVAGTTRDHIAQIVTAPDVDYLLLDTGGMGGGTEDKDFEDDVHAQSLLALKAADLILFVVDGKTEPVKNDFTVAEVLRKNRRKHVPILLVINKCDNDAVYESALHAFHKLGVGDEIMPVSAAHKIGFPELEEQISKQLHILHFAKRERLESSEGLPRIAIIGKPNVGKSSLINALMSETQRAVSPKLVSVIPGTTRDATDTIIRHHDQDYVFVDTAGLRRQARVEEDVESLAMLRTMQAIEECDVALLVLDGKEVVSKQDKRVANLAVEAGKGLIIILNKIDLLKSEEKKEKLQEMKAAFLFCRYAPVIPCSTVSREGLLKIFDVAATVQRNRTRHIETKDLRQFYENALQGQPMSSLATAKYITQAKEIPPTFVIFVRNPKRVQLSQLRYLDNRLRETFALEGTPVRWITKGPRDRRWKEDEDKGPRKKVKKEDDDDGQGVN